MSSKKDVQHLRTPLQHILLATNGFADQNLIGQGGSGNVYEGISEKHGRIAIRRLARGQGDHEFRTEIALLSKYKHGNIVSLLGFCDEDGEKILVYKYESNGSLERHLNNQDLTWIQRLSICIHAARGLKYLHDDVGRFYRDVKSSNILLDESWNPKIASTNSSFGISNTYGTPGYIDPDYPISGYHNQKSDVYSFGVVLWEVLCGRLALVTTYKEERRILTILAQKHFIRKTLHRIIPSYLHKQMNTKSLLTFSSVAYQCLKNVEERPTMKQVMEQLRKALHNQIRDITSLSIEVKRLQIPLQEISLATNGFANKNLITDGVHGKVYKGISETYGRIVVKRLDRRQGQGDHKFKKEIDLLSVYEHENIVSLLGFCDEDAEKILVYKHESKGSLDRHLSNKDLTWIQRLLICIDVARGLRYLHDEVAIQNRTIHRNIKSSNILLDENWKAKISDFGLSIASPANMQPSYLIEDACCTPEYIDPEYVNTGYLTEKADVYSFGVVLCEVLCGRLAHDTSYDDEHQYLTLLVKLHHRTQTLGTIIHSSLRRQINTSSLLTFSNIAYQCLKNVEERPTMKQVIEQLQITLVNQQVSCRILHSG
ncbi:uncharacterized protein LOC143627560 [Bidens hawaiensis]|uniref:uncharacterized protein LOC143627560 n=1 Tax=Bidens hawaiensis TaxID=980011 RepID=UPI00404B0DAA